MFFTVYPSTFLSICVYIYIYLHRLVWHVPSSSQLKCHETLQRWTFPHHRAPRCSGTCGPWCISPLLVGVQTVSCTRLPAYMIYIIYIISKNIKHFSSLRHNFPRHCKPTRITRILSQIRWHFPILGPLPARSKDCSMGSNGSCGWCTEVLPKCHGLGKTNWMW